MRSTNWRHGLGFYHHGLQRLLNDLPKFETIREPDSSDEDDDDDFEEGEDSDGEDEDYARYDGSPIQNSKHNYFMKAFRSSAAGCLKRFAASSFLISY